ncbi:hypothetical protein GCM10027073_26890 [Streptomyces chlorus]
MSEYGCFPSRGQWGQYGPTEPVEQARMAERAGFQALRLSDHHPWNDEQAQCPSDLVTW